MTKSFSLFRAEDRRALIRVGDPLEVGWFAEGRRATREEVAASIAGGLPKLVDVAQADGPDGIEDLRRQVNDFDFYLPAR
jgi:hypothetical protein